MKAYSSNIVIAGLVFALAIGSVNVVASPVNGIPGLSDIVAEKSLAAHVDSKAIDEVTKSIILDAQPPVKDGLLFAGWKNGSGHRGSNGG